MNHHKRGIFSLQCYRYFQEMLSNPSRCLSSSKFFSCGIHPTAEVIVKLGVQSFERVRNIWNRVGNVSCLSLLELKAYGNLTDLFLKVHISGHYIINFKAWLHILGTQVYTYMFSAWIFPVSLCYVWSSSASQWPFGVDSIYATVCKPGLVWASDPLCPLLARIKCHSALFSITQPHTGP